MLIYNASLTFLSVSLLQHSMGQVIHVQSRASVSQSVSQCVSSLLRPQFLFDFREILHSGSGLKSKIEFVWGKNPMTLSPILPRF